jgi:hypothetical protein
LTARAVVPVEPTNTVSPV